MEPLTTAKAHFPLDYVMNKDGFENRGDSLLLNSILKAKPPIQPCEIIWNDRKRNALVTTGAPHKKKRWGPQETDQGISNCS